MDVVTRPAVRPNGPTRRTGVRRLISGPVALRRWAVAALVANIGIVVTGALVRLTGSGLGCPTWPRCTAESYTTHPALGLHGAIEFGNRLLTFVLFAVVVATLVTAWRQGRRLPDRPRTPRGARLLAAVLLAGIPVQAVIGGISVLLRLNPFVVALHLLASLALIVVATVLVRRTYDLPTRSVPARTFWAARVTFVLVCVAVWVGTLVTGSGPHAGDEFAPRTGFDAVTVTHVHAAVVYAVVAGSVVCVVLLRSRAAVQLLLAVLLQGLIGFTQYFTGLPVHLVLLHLLGAALTMTAAANLTFSLTRSRPTADVGGPAAQLTASR
jgi:cytochrome c oxidase assembly protein subunit 15